MLKHLRNVAAKVALVKAGDQCIPDIFNHLCFSFNSCSRPTAEELNHVEYHDCWQQNSIATRHCAALFLEFLKVLFFLVFFVVADKLLCIFQCKSVFEEFLELDDLLCLVFHNILAF